MLCTELRQRDFAFGEELFLDGTKVKHQLQSPNLTFSMFDRGVSVYHRRTLLTRHPRSGALRS